MFRKTRSLFILFVLASGAAFVVFGGDPSDGGRAAGSRDFVSACEAGPFAAANATDMADAARLCSCLLSWHLREGARAGYPLPVERYRTEPPAGAAGSPMAATDLKAREACLSGRRPGTGP